MIKDRRQATIVALMMSLVRIPFTDLPNEFQVGAVNRVVFIGPKLERLFRMRATPTLCLEEPVLQRRKNL